MSYDHELTLVKQTYAKDGIGNQIPIARTKRTVLCKLKSVSRSEFYSAAVKGLRPEAVFEVNKYEYDDETEVEFEGKRYEVIRTYPVGFEDVELTCKKVKANV